MIRSSSDWVAFEKGLILGDRRLGGERQEPADLDRDAVAEKRRLSKVGPQRLELLVVASVQRGLMRSAVTAAASNGARMTNSRQF